MNGRSRCEIHPAFEVLFHAYLPFNSGLSSWTFCSVHFSERWRFLFSFLAEPNLWLVTNSAGRHYDTCLPCLCTAL